LHPSEALLYWPAVNASTSSSITVIIPVYQGAGTIAHAVRSVLDQTRPPDEILIVDDGSTDDLAGALRPFGSSITLILQPNGGAGSARNTGMERARGDFIAFLDADDYWAPTKLERQLEVFRADPTLGIVSCRWLHQWPSGGPRPAERRRFARRCRHFMDRPLAGSEEDLSELVDRLCMCTPLMRREAVDGHRFFPQLQTHQDRDFWLRVCARTRIFLMSEPLVTVVLGANSLSRDPAHLERNCRNLLTVAERNAVILGPRGIRRDRAAAYHKWARGHLHGGRPRAALKPALSHVALEPASPRAWWTLLRAAPLAILKPQPTDVS
jgi:glycosyltransferase involved in cell wall biosynthesis